MTTPTPSSPPSLHGLVEQWHAAERALVQAIRMTPLGAEQDVKIAKRETYRACINALEGSMKVDAHLEWEDQKAIAEREARCAALEASLAEREKQFDKREADVILREKEVMKLAGEVDQRRRENIAMQANYDAAGRALDEMKVELDKREALVLAREGRADTKEAAQRDAQRRLDERAKEAYDRLAAIANREGELDTRSAKLDDRETRVTEREARFEDWQKGPSSHDLRLALTRIVSLDSDPVPPTDMVIIQRVEGLKNEVQLSAGVSEHDAREAREKGGTSWENRLRARQEKLTRDEKEFRSLRELRAKVDALLQNNPTDTAPLADVDIISRISGMKQKLARYDAVPMLDMLLDSGIMGGTAQKSGMFLPPLQDPEFIAAPSLTKEFTDLAARFREDGQGLRESGARSYRGMGFTLMLVADEIDAVAKKVLGS